MSDSISSSSSTSPSPGTPLNDIYSCVDGGDIYKQDDGIGSFVALSQGNKAWRAMVATPSGHIYATEHDGDIYKQTFGTGDFAALSQTHRYWYSITVSPTTGSVYAADYGYDIYKQTSGSGAFEPLSQSNRAWNAMTARSNGDVYACVEGGDIYKQSSGVGAFNTLAQGNKSWFSMTTSAVGNVYAGVWGGDIYMQTAGSGAFNALGQTSRNWKAMTSTPNGDVYAVSLSAGSRFLYKQAGGSGAFESTGIAAGTGPNPWHGITSMFVGSSISSSASSSPSPSTSISTSVSTSPSPSTSVSASISTSPSPSTSVSTSISASPSPSSSISPSSSVSTSISSSVSPSSSVSSSISTSVSASPSPSPSPLVPDTSVKKLQYNSFDLQNDNFRVKDIIYRNNPTKVFDIEQRARRDGFHLLSTYYTEKKVSVSGTITCYTPAILKQKIDSMKSALSRDNGNLEIDDNGIVTQWVCSVESINIPEQHYHITRVPFEVSFVCQPFGKELTQTVHTSSITNASSSPFTGLLTATGSAAPYPVLRWTLVGNPSTPVTIIKFENTSTLDSITLSSLNLSEGNEYVEVDCDNMTVTIQKLNTLPVVSDFSGVFPRFSQTHNLFETTVTGGGASWSLLQTITYYPQYL